MANVSLQEFIDALQTTLSSAIAGRISNSLPSSIISTVMDDDGLEQLLDAQYQPSEWPIPPGAPPS